MERSKRPVVSGIMTVLSPNFDSVMRRVMTNMNMPTPDVYSAPIAHLRGTSVIALIFPLAILGLLAYYRPRFLEACAAKTAKSSTQQNPALSGNSPTQSPTKGTEPSA